jgi:shikimate kinase
MVDHTMGATDHIVLVGAMATGKTTVGKRIAERLGLGYVDSDDQILALPGRGGARIAEDDGVEVLHQLELQVFWDAVNSADRLVIAAAASVIENETAREAIRESRCVWVDAPEDTLRLRRSSASHRREVSEAESLRLAARGPLFASCATVKVDTDSANEQDAVSIAIEAITGLDEG